MTDISLNDLQESFGLTEEEKQERRERILNSLSPDLDISTIRSRSGFERALNTADPSKGHQKIVWSKDTKDIVVKELSSDGTSSDDRGLGEEVYFDSTGSVKASEYISESLSKDEDMITRYMLIKNIPSRTDSDGCRFADLYLYEGHRGVTSSRKIYFGEGADDKDIIIPIHENKNNFPLDLTLMVDDCESGERLFSKYGRFPDSNTKRIVIDLDKVESDIIEPDPIAGSAISAGKSFRVRASSINVLSGPGGRNITIGRNIPEPGDLGIHQISAGIEGNGLITNSAISLSNDIVRTENGFIPKNLLDLKVEDVNDLKSYLETEIKKSIKSSIVVDEVKAQLREEVIKELFDTVVNQKMSDMDNKVDLLKADIETGMVTDHSYRPIDLNRISGEIASGDIQVYDALKELVRERIFPGTTTTSKVWGDLDLNDIKQDLMNENSMLTALEIEDTIKKLIRGRLNEGL